jgi:RNA 3'-terminal phosphate cyclase
VAKGNSAFTTTRITEHLLTNLWVIQHFKNVKISVIGEKGREGKVELFTEEGPERSRRVDLLLKAY